MIGLLVLTLEPSLVLRMVEAVGRGTFIRGQGPGSEGLNYPEDSSVAAYSGSQHRQQIGSLEKRNE